MLPVTTEQYDVPNYVVESYTENGLFVTYYVPQAKDADHAINQVRQWMFVMFGIQAPWLPEYGSQQVKILEFKAKKLDNTQIAAL